MSIKNIKEIPLNKASLVNKMIKKGNELIGSDKFTQSKLQRVIKSIKEN